MNVSKHALVIAVSILIGVLGYSIMPDSTPDANDGATQIKNQPPGFAIDFLLVRKNIEVEQYGWFHKLLHGQESKFKIRPFTSYRIDGLDIYTKQFGEGDRETRVSMIDVIDNLYVGRSEKLDSENNYVLEGDRVRYVDHMNEACQVSVLLNGVCEEQRCVTCGSLELCL